MTNTKKTRIPNFASVREETEFGNAHDTTNYEAEFKPARGRGKHMYKVLDEMNGAGDPTLVDTSTTIDDVLYGENGAWRGTMPTSREP